MDPRLLEALLIPLAGFFLYHLIMTTGRVQGMFLKCRANAGKVGLRRTSRRALGQSLEGMQAYGGGERLMFRREVQSSQVVKNVASAYVCISAWPLASCETLVIQSLSHVLLFAIPWTATHQASLSFTISWSLLKFISIESVMPSNHLILCHPLLLLPSIFPSIRVFSNESALHIGCRYS